MLFPSCACFRQEIVDSGSSRLCLSQMDSLSSKSSQARPPHRLAIGESRTPPRQHRSSHKPPLRSPTRLVPRRSASERGRRRSQRSRTPRAWTPRRAAEPRREPTPPNQPAQPQKPVTGNQLDEGAAEKEERLVQAHIAQAKKKVEIAEAALHLAQAELRMAMTMNP